MKTILTPGHYLHDAKGQICKVERVDFFDGEIKVLAQAIKSAITHMPLRPILFDETILYKMDFYSSGSPGRSFREYKHKNLAQYDFTITNAQFLAVWYGNFLLELKGLHELQSFFFMHGKELEIKASEL